MNTSKPDEETPVIYHYRFDLHTEHVLDFEIELHPQTLAFTRQAGGLDPIPIEEGLFPCVDCPIKESGLRACPVIENISPYLHSFRGMASYDKVRVTIESRDRFVSHKEASLQQAISSMIGIIMVTSGCPDLDKLRPMVRLHLPMASVNETMYRAVSTYLFAQYMRNVRGLDPDWNLDSLIAIYKRIEQINRDLSDWMRLESKDDTSTNAIIILDIFAKMLPRSVEQKFGQFEELFAPYLD